MNAVNEVLTSVRVLLSIAFLAYASWSDLKRREVDDVVWVVFAPLAFILTFLQFLLFYQRLLYMYALSFILTLGLSIALFYTGMFGGADAKALMCLSLALPIRPEVPFQPLAGGIPFFPFITFCNAVLLAASSVFYMVIRNCFWKYRTKRSFFEGFEGEPRWRKLLVFLCGYKVKAESLERTNHLYPLEDISVEETGESKRKLLLMLGDEEKRAVVMRLLEAVRKRRIQDDVWVTPGLPFIVFITIGLIIALTLGDLVWVFLTSHLVQASFS